MFERYLSAEDCLRFLRSCSSVLFVCLLVLLTVNPAVRAQSPGGPTRLLRTPTVSATQIAFAYANNIWVVPRTVAVRAVLPAFKDRPRTRISLPTVSGSLSAANMQGTSTSMSFLPMAASRGV
jgi:hypothetical protein